MNTRSHPHGRLESRELDTERATEPNRAVLKDIARLGPWFHNLHLPDGTQTAPKHLLGDFPSVKWQQIAPLIAPDLSGCRVLDIGCNAGFYSFELANRGAEVTAMDIDPHYLEQASWAARQFGLTDRVELRQGSVYELAGSRERFDLVCFLGVLYHLRHPLLALDIIRRVTGGQMLLQTMTMPGEEVWRPPESIELGERELMTLDGWPKMAFVERYLEDDPTNWWAPNHACVEAMARAAGFVVVARPGHEIYLCEPDSEESLLNRELRESELRALLRIAGSSGAYP